MNMSGLLIVRLSGVPMLDNVIYSALEPGSSARLCTNVAVCSAAVPKCSPASGMNKNHLSTSLI